MTITNRGKHFIALARITYTDTGLMPGISLLGLTPSRPISAMAVYARHILEKDPDSAKQREKKNQATHDTRAEEISLIVSYWEKMEDEMGKQHHQFDLLTITEQQGSISLTAAKGILNGPRTASNPHPQEESIIRHLFAFRGTHLSVSMGDSSFCLVAVTGDGVVLTYWLGVPSESAVDDTARCATLGGGGRQTDISLSPIGSKCCEYVVLYSERFMCPCGSVRNVWTAPSCHLESPVRLVLVGSGADYLIQPTASQTVAAHYHHMRSSSGTTVDDVHSTICKSHASDHEGQNEAGGSNVDKNGLSSVEDTYAEHPVSWSFERIARPPGSSTFLAPFIRASMYGGSPGTSTPPGPCHGPSGGSLKDYLPCTAFAWIQRVHTRAVGITTDPKHTALPPSRSSESPVQLALCVGYMRKGANPQIDVCTYVRSVVRTVLVTPDGSKCIIFSQGNKSPSQSSPQDGCLEVYDSTTLEKLWSSALNAEMRSAVQSTISICPPFFPSFLSKFSILSDQHHNGCADPRSVVTFGHLFAVQEGDTWQHGHSSPSSASTFATGPPSSSSGPSSPASAIAIWRISLPSSTTNRVVDCYLQRPPNPSHPIPYKDRDRLALMGCCTVRGEIDCFCLLDDKLVSFTLSGKITVSGWVAADDGSEESTESKTTKQRTVQPDLNGARAVLRSDPLHLSTLCELQTDLEPFSVVEILSSRSDTIIVSLATGGICIYYLLFDEIYLGDVVHSMNTGRTRGMGGKRDSLCRTYSLTRGHTFPLPHCLLTNIKVHQTPDSDVVRLFCADRMSQSLAIITIDIIAGTEYVKKQKKVEKLTLKLLSHGTGPNSYLKCCVDDLFDIVLDDRNSSSSFALLDRGCRVSHFSEGRLAHSASVVSSLPN
jgi:hypothetical protein